jgi:hypothetical protein
MLNKHTPSCHGIDIIEPPLIRIHERKNSSVQRRSVGEIKREKYRRMIFEVE